MNVITVTQLNTYIKSLLDENPILKTIYIKGEISNFKHYYKSGHMYLTLKDSNCQLKAVMFSSFAARLKFVPEDGMCVICRGRISAYEKDGVYQLYIEDMQPDGVGSLAIAFAQLKEKLEKEGLFDSAHKKPIPEYPKKIGIATSNMGAAIEDIKNITKRRYPIAELVIAPTIVQGDCAPEDIVRSIRCLDDIEDIDVIIVGRGGGSLEDLWAFNTEMVARAVYECRKPVISAVGHETDFTICDFAADLRAETPSAAAEKAVPDRNELLRFVENAESRMLYSIRKRFEYEAQRLDFISNESILANHIEFFDNKYDVLVALQEELTDAYKKKLDEYRYHLGIISGKLDALSPLAVLARGYAAIKNENHEIIKSKNDIHVNDKVNIKFIDGSAVCTVDEVENYGNDL